MKVRLSVLSSAVKRMVKSCDRSLLDCTGLFLMTRIVSLASIVAAPVVVLVIYLVHMPMEYVIFSALAAAIIIGKHHSNIRRLLAGEEKKITRDK